MSFPEIFKNLRKENNFNQNEIAERLYTTRSTISDWETGRSEPSVTQLIKVSKVFNCTVDYLVGLENDFGIVTAQSSALTLTKEESEMLATFKLLTLEEQYQAIGFVKALAY